MCLVIKESDIADKKCSRCSGKTTLIKSADTGQFFLRCNSCGYKLAVRPMADEDYEKFKKEAEREISNILPSP